MRIIIITTTIAVLGNLLISLTLLFLGTQINYETLL